MRICYLAQADSVHTMKWVKHFAEIGHDVSLISFSDPIWEIKGLKFYKLKKIFSERIGYVLNLKRLKGLLKEIKPDILHAHYATNYGLLGALSGFHPYVLSVWGSDIFITPRRSIFHRKLIEFNLSKADVVCSTSNIMAEETKKYLSAGKDVLVTPFGVDVSRFIPSSAEIEKKEIVICTIKALVPGKGYGTDLLIEVFSKLCKKHSNLRLRIIGEGRDKANFKKLAKELGVESKTEFMGYVPHTELPRILSGIDIYCCLSQTDNESFGVAPLEASSCAKPVVCSNIGGLPEVVQNGKTGFIVDVLDKNGIENALEKLICNPSLREGLGRNGRDFVMQKYNWVDNANIMENIYKRVVNE